MNKILLGALLFFAHFGAAQQCWFQDELTSKFGLCDPSTGEPRGPADFDAIRQKGDSDTLVVARKNGKAGIVSATGRVVVPLDFDEVFLDWHRGLSFGLAAVLRLSPSREGLIRLSDGKTILPTEFEATGAVSPKLVFGRRAGSKSIEFFDENGQKLFEKQGRSAGRGASKTDFLLHTDAGDWLLFDARTGQEIKQSEQPTEGDSRIVQKFGKFGSPETAALIDAKTGDTLLSARRIEPIGNGRNLVFIGKKGANYGLSDDRGKWIIEPSAREMQLLDREAPARGALLLTDEFGSIRHIFSKNGELLIDSCQIGPVEVDKELARLAKNSKPERLLTVSKFGKTQATGLIDLEGRLLVPMEYKQLQYGSEDHLVISARRTPDRAAKYNAHSHDPLKNRDWKAFPEDFDGLRFTRDPAVFWARKGSFWAPIDVWKQFTEPPNFEFGQIERLPSLWVVATKNFEKKLFDPFGKPVSTAVFDEVQKPERRHFEDYFDRTKQRGQLVAIGTRRTDPAGAWHGIAANGSSIFFRKEDTSRPIEVIVEATDGIIEEAPPPKAAPAPTSVEKQSDEPMTLVEEMPRFPGDEAALLGFFRQNLRYPPLAKENGIQGRVIVQFIVEKDGALTDAKILRDIGGGCGNEALRLIAQMPKWAPGNQRGQPVRTQYTLPVSFKLD